MANTAPSSGASSHAICSELKPEYDVPNMPTRPLHHSCAASQATTSTRSACSAGGYSSVASPADEPVPRRSSRHTANPNRSRRSSYPTAYDDVRSSLR